VLQTLMEPLTGWMSWPKKRPIDKELLASKGFAVIHPHAVPAGGADEAPVELVQLAACSVC
jgi:hypothetical protein